MCECISCRSGLFAYLARAPFHFSNSHAPTLNLPPTNYCYCCEIFFSQTTCLARYTWRLLVRTSFYLSSIWHRIASFRFRFIANWIAPPPQPRLVLLAIAYLLSCYLLSVFTLHWSTFNFTAERSSQRRLKGSLLSWFCTIWIMIQLNFNQKSMNCQFHAHTLAHTCTHAYLAYVTLSLSHMWHSLRVCRNQKLCFTCPQKVCNAKSKLQAV